MNWTDERCEQLKLLQHLLNNVSSLNRANNVIGNLICCLADCEELKRVAFMNFLNDLAIAERTQAKEAK